MNKLNFGGIMGFFGKIKENINRGGVKIAIVAPDRLEKGQTAVQVQATLSSAETRQIKSVMATVERQYVGNTNNDEQPNQRDILTKQEYATGFSLPAGQPLSLNFTLNIDPAQQFGDNALANQASAVVDKLGKLYNSAKMRSYLHNVYVYVDVEGISFDPEASKRIIIDGQEQSKVSVQID